MTSEGLYQPSIKDRVEEFINLTNTAKNKEKNQSPVTQWSCQLIQEKNPSLLVSDAMLRTKILTFYLWSSWYTIRFSWMHLLVQYYQISLPNCNNVNKRAHNTTWVYSNDCQREAAISGDFPNAASVFNSSAFNTGGILHCRSPRITTTGVHWGCSQSAKRAFSLWVLNTKRTRETFHFQKLRKITSNHLNC